MLLLARRRGEKLVLLLGDQILATITVQKLGTSTVKLAIKARRDVAVLREELLWQLIAANDGRDPGTSGREESE